MMLPEEPLPDLNEPVGENEFLEDYIARWSADMEKVLSEFGIQDQQLLDNLVEVAYHHVEKDLLVFFKIKRILGGDYDV
jgi:hypothetical protein